MFEKILSVPRSLILCIILFGLREGIKLPILFHYTTKINIKNSNIVTNINFGRVLFGFGGSAGIISPKKSFFSIKNATVHFNGKANFSQGCSLRIDKGEAHFGKDFFLNKNGLIYFNGSLYIGDSVILGWNVQILSGEEHFIVKETSSLIPSMKIKNNIWIASNVILLNGTTINSNSVVATGAVCNKKYQKNSLIGGIPAVEKKYNITWKK